MRHAFGRLINYFLAFLLLGIIQGCTHHVPHPPISLVAGHNPITMGDSTTLTASWPTTGASASASGSVDQGVGTVTNGTPVTITPTADTTYTLTYTDPIGTLHTAVTVHVVAAPTTPIITAPAEVTAGATGLTASVPAQADGSYTWTVVGGAITAGAGTPQITFSAGTSGTVQLSCIVTNAAGTASLQGTATSTIVSAPGATAITAPAFVTSGATGLIASVPSQAGDTYAWTLTGGTISSGAATNQIIFSAGASGTVSLACVVTNSAGTAAPQATATCVIVAPPAVPVITAPADVTAGAAGLTASVPAQAASTYAWTITGGVVTAGAGTTLITFTAGTSGTIQLTCVASNAAGTASAPGTASTAIVAAPGTPVVSAPAFVTAGAAGLTASVPLVVGDRYAWTITSGTITAGGATNVITFTAGATGSVQVSCVVTNAAGTPSPAGVAFCTIVAAPVTPVITAPAAVTAGASALTASISNTASEPTGSTYAWTITSGGTITAGATSPSITFTAGASGPVAFSCKVTTTAGATSTGTFSSTVVAAPVAPDI